MSRKLLFIISFVAVLGVSFTSPASADLVGWWRFDDGSGTTAMDSSGNGNDGTLNGGATWTDGRIGGAIQFNGADSAVIAPYIPLNNQSFTIAMWVNPVLYTDQTVVFSQVQTNSQHLSMHYRLWGDGRVRMGFYSNDLDTAAGTVADNNWYHIIFWYDFENQTRRIYIDGVQTAEDAGVPYLGASGDTVIGMWDGTAQWFRGMIDDVQIYDHPLTENEIQASMLGIEGFPLASGANPKDGTLLEDTWVTMTWRAGDFAVSHDVYMSDNFDDVDDGTEAAFQGNQGNEMFIVGFPGFPYPDGLVPGTTYYWRIDEVNDADPNSPWKGPVWSFWVPPKKAYEPVPADGTKVLDPDTTLSWTAGFGTKLHTVYFGDDFEIVSNAGGGAPQGAATFDPGPLAADTTYYWRIDEFDAFETHKGDVWSFRTLPDIPITDPNLVGWWKFDEGSGTVALDMSGHGNHGALQGDPQWVSGRDGGALEFDGAGDYVDCGNSPSISPTTELTVMAWIKVNPWTKTWEAILAKGDNSYRLSRSGSGNATHFGCGGTSGNYFDGSVVVTDNEWRHVAGVYNGASMIIYIDGVEDTRIPSTGSVTASANNLFIGENSGAAGRHITGLIDDVRLYNKALTVEEIAEAMRGDTTLAGKPSPSDGSTVDVKAAVLLTWLPGDNAVQQDVYLGTDRSTVEDVDASDATGIYRGQQSGTSYTPAGGLPWGTGPYFWRVDQVNSDGTIGRGRVWSFTVADFLIVDDFEDYTDNDTADEAIWQNWSDGFGVNTNGSQAGYAMPTYVEQTIVHGGSQSMPLFYTNTGGVTNSQVELKLGSAARDWTEEGVGELTIWFQGQAASTGSFVEGPVGTFTMTGSGTDIWGNADEFHFAYRTLTGAGSIVARVISLEETNVWAKAGVMIRETLEPGSKNAMVAVTPGNGVSSQWRADPDAGSSNAAEGGITAPHWVRLERDLAGNFTASHSTNGTTWVPVQNATPQNIQMTGTVFIGLAVTSHDAALTAEGVLSNVTITGNVAGQWTNQDIGIASNAAEPLYVAVSNAAGSPVVVPHPDPAAANVDTWTEWVIPLSTFSDQGINLNDVDKIAIGLGSGSGAASPGGSGVMFIDDIRLYRPRP